MTTLKKLEKKVIKKIIHPQPTKIAKKERGILASINNIGGKIRKGITESTIGINTPWGGVGYGLKGLVLNPPGTQTESMYTTTSRTGKRSYYITGTAPRLRGYTSGLRVVACQKLCAVVQSSSDNGALQNAAGSRTSNVGLSPDAIGGQMALDARNYARFRFSSVAIEYLPLVQVGATSSGSMTAISQTMVLAYLSDAVPASFQTLTGDNLESVADSTLLQVWAKGGLLVQNLGTPQFLYYTEVDTTSLASDRQCIQGSIAGMWNSPSTGTTSDTFVGELIIHYVMDLYDRTSDYGFTISVHPTIGLEVLEYLFKTYGDKLCRRDRCRLLTMVRPPPTKEPSILDSEIWEAIGHSSTPYQIVDKPPLRDASPCRSLKEEKQFTAKRL
jgi:hypothetical protein